MKDAPSATLLCYDGSDSSKHAIAVAGETLATDKVVLLHIWETPVDFVVDSLSEPSTRVGRPHAELEADEILWAKTVAAEGMQLASAAGLDAELELRPAHGNEWQVILDVATSLDAGLIVVGTRGRTAVEDGLLGTSVSKEVLRHSSRPVLLVPGAAGAESSSDDEEISISAAYEPRPS